MEDLYKFCVKLGFTKFVSSGHSPDTFKLYIGVEEKMEAYSALLNSKSYATPAGIRLNWGIEKPHYDKNASPPPRAPNNPPDVRQQPQS
jgi:hypothetical protein